MPHLTTEQEQILTQEGRSISLMVNPDLSDFFFWHFHPEFELVYICGASGTRHVGTHLSDYQNSDLVLIGSHIPHLNFDYGVKSTYQKRVVHFTADFPQTSLQPPEFASIARLFHEAAYGIAFSEAAKAHMHRKLLALDMSEDPITQYLQVIDILLHLAEDPARMRLHDDPVENRNTQRDHDRLTRIFRFVEENYQRRIENKEAASLSNLSEEAFCRYFKKMTRLTFTAFVNQYRIDKAKKLLLMGNNATEACFETGFESLPYFTRTFKRHTGESPIAFKKRTKLHTV